MTLAEFYRLLERHDWYYFMSDDSRAYRQGTASIQNLKQIIADSGDERFSRLYEAYKAFAIDNDGQSTPRLEDFE